jgi:hypothetical protein
MIIKGNEFRRHANFVNKKLKAGVVVESGQMVMEDANGEILICDGTKRGYMSFSSKCPSKDDVTDKGGYASYAIGDVIVTIDEACFVTGQTYNFGTRLKSNGTGKLTPIVEGTDRDNLVCAEALGSVKNATLRVRML